MACPSNSGCKVAAVAVTTNATKQGQCECNGNYSFNVNYTTETDYCVGVPNTVTIATPVPTVASTTAKVTTVATAPPTKPTTVAPVTTTTTAAPDEVKVNPAPDVQPHHFMGGIFFPLMMVFAFVGIAFAVRRFNVVERVQNYMHDRNARRRHHYMDNFDEFDDPLLI